MPQATTEYVFVSQLQCLINLQYFCLHIRSSVDDWLYIAQLGYRVVDVTMLFEVQINVASLPPIHRVFSNKVIILGHFKAVNKNLLHVWRHTYFRRYPTIDCK